MAGPKGLLLVMGAILLLLLVHELGHLVLALACRVRVARLTLGVGPTIFSGEIRGLHVSVRLLPVIASLSYATEGWPEDDSYATAPAWKRCLVDLGGPLASYATAAALVFGLALSGWLTPTPAQEPVPQRLGTAAELAVLVPVELTREQLGALQGLVLRREVERLQGPLAFGGELAVAAQRGPWSFAAALALLSVAIGFFNLLPIPGLDGGKLAYNVVELVGRRPIAPAIRLRSQAICLCLLLALVALLTAVELDFPYVATAGALAAPLLIGASVGLLRPAGSPRAWSRTIVVAASILGALAGLAAMITDGFFVGLIVAASAALVLGLPALLALAGYRISGAWRLRTGSTR
jgi:regulator of sigma E protease